MSSEKVFFKNLDSIRFIAALMVFLGHAVSPSFQYLPIKDTYWEKLLNTISSGGTGVSIFFVLSGFLITYLLISEYELNQRISIGKFYMRRVLRIWPLYFLVLAFTFFVYPFIKSMIGMNNPLASNVFYHLTFLSNFDVINVHQCCAGSDAMSQNITWSVSIEEQFYVVWPLIFVMLPKRMWVYAISLVILVSIIFRLVNSSDGTVLYFHTFSVMLDLGMGGLMALLVKSNKKFRQFFENTSTLTHASFLVMAFCFVFWKDDLFHFSYGNAISRIFSSFSFALIITAQALTKQQSVLNLGNLSFANRWGKYAYGIYLIHPIVITLVDVMVRMIDIPKDNLVSSLLVAAVIFVLTVLFSKISYTYFESKFLLLKDRFSAIKTNQ